METPTGRQAHALELYCCNILILVFGAALNPLLAL